VELYVHRLAAPDQPPALEDAEELSTLEHDLTYEDIRFFRSVARAQAKKDAATRLRLEEEKRKAQPQTSGWSGWFWGGGKSASEGEGPTEADQKEIDDIIEYDASDALTVGSVPSNFMKLRVSAKLNKGSFSLQEEPHGRKADIIALVFDSFSADAVQLVDSVSGKIALGGFRVYDGTRENTLYPQIVRVKEDRKSPSRQTSLAIGGVDGAVEDLQDDLQETDEQAIAEKDPFFVMEVEHNPLDGRADNAVTIKMRHLEIIYHKGYVEAVVQFFKPPESQLESIGALLVSPYT
jgi:vacuolar protein sorting-associated protein 13A/C